MASTVNQLQRQRAHCRPERGRFPTLVATVVTLDEAGSIVQRLNEALAGLQVPLYETPAGEAGLPQSGSVGRQEEDAEQEHA